MANVEKPLGFFILDQKAAEESQHEEHSRLSSRIRQFFSSRYAFLTICTIISGSLIFYNTAALQLNPSSVSGISETAGVSRQQTISAARGDIIDASGIPLAYSVSVNTLSITYAGLETKALNAMLLDLSLFLSENGVEIEDELGEYFRIDHSACTHNENAGSDCGQPIFNPEKPMEEIIDWQNDSNTFNLNKISAETNTSFYDSNVKTDPVKFYNWLLYFGFKIEDINTDGLKYTQAEAYRIMQLRFLIKKDYWAFSNGTPLEFARGVSDQIVAIINEQNYRFMGVITGREYERAYTDDAISACHVLGYVGQISASQYETLSSQGYSMDAVIGQTGVESTAERYLAGQDGIKPYNTWTVEEETGSFYSEAIGKDAVPGYNVRLTIDLDLQKIAEASLQTVIENIRNSPKNANKGDADAGAVIMIDVRTGAILVMVSYPGYDPNDFVLQSFDQAAAARVKEYIDPKNISQPLFNRAIMGAYAPGSTFKPVTVTAALESGVITPTSNTIRCRGTEVIGEWLWHCLEYPVNGHGNLTLTRAIATSCNMYFFNLGYMTQINNIDYWAKMLGLGEYTGIDLPGEVKGMRSNRENKEKTRSEPGDKIWFPADTCQSAIGQLDNSYTVVQLAVYAAALATGNRVTPHVISEITSNDGVIIQQYNGEPIAIGLQDSTLAAIRAGMVAAASTKEGTAYNAFKGFPISVAAKTGTAETGNEDTSSSNGLFICYAPAENPQVAIAQIVEKGAWGSNTIGIARDLLTEYFDLTETAELDTAAIPGLTDVLTP